MNFIQKSILLLVLVSNFALAQTQVFKGHVYDQITKEPIQGAQIKLISNPQKGTVSQSDGAFELKVNAENEMISVSFLGYKNTEVLMKNDLNVSLFPSSEEIETVVVTANRTASLRREIPMAISKLSPRMIDETKAISAFEIINKTPGVLMSSLGNEQHFMSIRQPIGTSAYYLYLEDGLPIRPLGIFNHNAVLEINQFAISNIEVVKGPVSSIYGPEAVGGAINFVTQKPTAVPTAKLGFQVDNWGFRRVQFGAGARSGKLGFYVGGLASKQTNSWMSSSDYDKTTINTRFDYYFSSKTRLIHSLVYGKYDSQMSGSVNLNEYQNRAYTSTSDFTYRKSDAIRTRLTLEHDWSKDSKSFLTIFYRNNQLGQNPTYGIRWNPDSSKTNNPNFAKGEVNLNKFESVGLVGQHTMNLPQISSKIMIGSVLDFTENEYFAHFLSLNAIRNQDKKTVKRYEILQERPDSLLVNYNGNIINAGLYGQFDSEPIKNLHLSIGLRYDVMKLRYENFINSSKGDIKYENLTPKIGLTYNLSKKLGFYTNYARGFSPPNLTAIFRPKPNTKPVEFYTNLKPAYFDNYEIGGWASLLQKVIKFDWAVYVMKGNNELLTIRQKDGSNDFQSAGKTLHRGVEFGLNANPSEQISFRIGGTRALHRFEDFIISISEKDNLQNLAGKTMPTSPDWSVNAEWSYYPAWFKNFRISNEWQYVSGWYENQINTVKSSNTLFVNMRVGYKWKSLEVYSNIMNLTDALYATSSSRGNFPNNASTYYPGTPRTYVFGIQYNWEGRK
ncbi:MAG: TonB-dependent receptor [Pseudarcicella sp.]|nr:TonB-dependent receptor [Pseudarcicella sp.]